MAFGRLRKKGINLPDELNKDLELLIMKTNNKDFISRVDVEELKRIVNEMIRITNEQIN